MVLCTKGRQFEGNIDVRRDSGLQLVVSNIWVCPPFPQCTVLAIRYAFSWHSCTRSERGGCITRFAVWGLQNCELCAYLALPWILYALLPSPALESELYDLAQWCPIKIKCVKQNLQGQKFFWEKGFIEPYVSQAKTRSGVWGARRLSHRQQGWMKKTDMSTLLGLTGDLSYDEFREEGCMLCWQNIHRP